MVILEDGDPGIFDRGTVTRKMVHQLSSTGDPIFNLRIPANRIVGGYDIKDGVLVPRLQPQRGHRGSLPTHKSDRGRDDSGKAALGGRADHPVSEREVSRRRDRDAGIGPLRTWTPGAGRFAAPAQRMFGRQARRVPRWLLRRLASLTNSTRWKRKWRSCMPSAASRVRRLRRRSFREAGDRAAEVDSSAGWRSWPGSAALGPAARVSCSWIRWRMFFAPPRSSGIQVGARR